MDNHLCREKSKLINSTRNRPQPEKTNIFNEQSTYSTIRVAIECAGALVFTACPSIQRK